MNCYNVCLLLGKRACRCRKEASAQQTMNLWVPCLVRRPVPSSKQKREKAQSSISISTEGKRSGHSLFPSGRASKHLHHVQNVPYASAVGSIMYVTAVNNTLKYLRNTKYMFLVYGGNPEAEIRVYCYCDAEFETDRDDTKSQTGYVFILNGGAVDWKSSKQSTTAMSTIEAEYIAASEVAMEAVWIRKFISGLGIVPTINEPIGMFCDNSATLQFANELGVQKGTKHFHRRYHYVRECIALHEIRFLKLHTYDNLADPFTKALPKGKLTQHARSMGLHLASSFM
ncbi:hypothetical protein Tco_0331867 [Tanacetum coccineum]